MLAHRWTALSFTATPLIDYSRSFAETKSLGRHAVLPRAIEEAERLLRPIVASKEVIDPATADELAWKLRKAFDGILEVSRMAKP